MILASTKYFWRFIMIISCKDINKSFGINTILENISFHIEEKEKVAIVGSNGAGKTTLFKILARELSLDAGEVFLRKDASIGYMAQNQQIEGKRSIYDEMLTVFEKLIQAEANLREMENEMSTLKGNSLSNKMEEYAKLQQLFEQYDGYGYQSHIRGVLKGLGFSETEFDQPLHQLSGGQKTRVYLGKLLLSKPDLLLLDEPTNHLDIESLQWLEDFLKNYGGAVIIISHDRYFLDKIVTKVIEIENKKSSLYEGNYTFYREQKLVRREIQQKTYEQQQKEIERQEDVIRTLRSFNREKSIKRAESREKTLKKMELVDKPDQLPEHMRLSLVPKITSGNDVLHAEDLAKGFSEKQLFSNVSFDVKRGDKVAIIGPNGVGKSTLFKMLLKTISQDQGTIRLGANVHIGYYDQEQENLNVNKTIFQEIADTYPTMTQGQIRNVLAAFVFTGDDIFKPISSLSGGEKGRVSLAKIMLSEANLLMLDEPTNHLDLFSKGILEDALNRYQGTVIYISHDRYFINRTAEKILELSPHGMTEYLGNYDYYLEKKSENIRIANENIPVSSEKKPIASPISDSKAEWLKQKEEQAQQRKIASKISKIEKDIESIETKINELDVLLFREDIQSDVGKTNDIFQEKTSLEESLETLYEQWETLQSC